MLYARLRIVQIAGDGTSSLTASVRSMAAEADVAQRGTRRNILVACRIVGGQFVIQLMHHGRYRLDKARCFWHDRAMVTGWT